MKIMRSAARLLLPQPIRSSLSISLKEKVSRRIRSYLRSNNAELDVTLDMIVSDYRRKQPHVFFLEIGACDGVSHDAVYPIIQKHSLKGVLVEPQKMVFEKLRANYSGFDPARFILVNAAIAEFDGELPLYRVDPGPDIPGWIQGSASFDKNVLLKQGGSVRGLSSMIKTERVRALSFRSLYDQVGIEHVDLLQIDAEGYDAVILRLFDIPARKPAIVRFEFVHLHSQVYRDCLDLLISQGYKISLGFEDALAYNPEY
jgi:FkbM family methyltransferase